MDPTPSCITFPAWTLVNIATFRDRRDLIPRVIAPSSTSEIKSVFLLFASPNIAKSTITELALSDTAVLTLKKPKALQTLVTASLLKLGCTHVAYNSAIGENDGVKVHFFPVQDVVDAFEDTTESQF
jgi:hypothetical protein